MDTGLSIADTAMTALQMKPVAAPAAGGKNMAAIEKAANEFESVFIAQFMGTMFSGIKSDGITGGGQGEEMFRSLLVNQYAESMQAQGGFGLAAQVKAQMLKMQEG
jgi:flagellar protein FlgJ